ncbi:23S rRNA (uridine(2552)-2'-O)-methyltransferase RlmE [soil metagenome]
MALCVVGGFRCAPQRMACELFNREIRMKSRRPSSRRWLAEHEQDAFVHRARAEGWRSRAVFKLIEIQKRERILRPGMTCIDLGASPGGWSQYAAGIVGTRGRVVALDRLPMEPVTGVEFIHGDFHEPEVLETLKRVLGESRADLVMADMAPNLTGMGAIDQPRAMALAELARDLACEVLVPGGNLLVKTFQGEGFQDLVNDLKTRFQVVKTRKPAASRARSNEVYLVARNYRMV